MPLLGRQTHGVQDEDDSPGRRRYYDGTYIISGKPPSVMRGMSGLQELIRKKREEILRIAELHGARNVRIFGSVGRGEEKGGSDLDLLVEFEPGRSLLDHVALVQDLEDLLSCHVDVVTERSLHWYIRERVREEARAL